MQTTDTQQENSAGDAKLQLGGCAENAELGLGAPRISPGYKQTEVGVIPTEWEACCISDLFHASAGGDVDLAESSGTKTDGHPYPIYANAISKKGLYGYCSYATAKAGAVTVTARGTLGQAFYRERPFVAIGRLLVLEPNHDVNARYFADYINYGITFASESTGVPQLTAPQVGRYFVPRPPLREQRAIAEALSDVDELIESLDKLIAKKRAIKQAAMQQLLTSETRLPGFSGEWETKRLSDIGTFSKGRGIRRDDVSNEGVPCIRYGELYTRYQNYLQEPFSRIPVAVAQTALPVATGDLLFAGSGETAEDIGQCAAYLGEEPAYAGGDIVVLSPSGQNSIYLGHLMNHHAVTIQKARFGQGDAVVHISARNLARIAVDLPPIEEQNAIATILSDMDAEIAALEKRRNKTRQIKQGMMQELLTGRTRLL